MKGTATGQAPIATTTALSMSAQGGGWDARGDGAETVIGAGRRSGRGDCAEMRAETRINGA